MQQGNALSRMRSRIGFGGAAVALGCAVWFVTPGLPIWGVPRARASVKAAGLALFEHEWEPHDPLAKGDGLGPVFNGRSCVACHSQGGVGGGGGNKHNVRAFEAMPTKDRPDVEGGLVHAFAVKNHLLEGQSALRSLFPIVPGGVRVASGCQILTRDFDPIRTESINSTALFGAGWVERLPGKLVIAGYLKQTLAATGRELDGNFDGMTPGRPRVLPDGRLGKFGWKAQFATLEEFIAAACANEIGLGCPDKPQAKPLGKVKYPDVEADLDHTQFAALSAFIDTLPCPTEVVPADSGEADRAVRGKAVFESVGCASCHTPKMGNLVGVYSDFLLHRLDDQTLGRPGSSYGPVETPEVPPPHAHPLPEEWKTPALWGVADSAPYFHDGGSPTLEAAILRHEGNAAGVTRAYKKLAPPDREALQSFLKTLKAPADAKPAGPEIASGTLASR